MARSVSFVVVNWNGEEVLPRCLDAISGALDTYEGPGEVLVVDNGSSDRSVALIEEGYPHVKLVALKENLGFSEGNNIGVGESTGDIVILVNNDAYVHPDFLVPILPHFDDEQVFSVTPKVYGLDGSTLTIGKTGAYFYRGMIRLKFSGDIYTSPVPCLWATGGSGAFDREKYLELGGLLELLYWEDLEFGYRAWKQKGWKTIYEPRSLVYHDHGTSFMKVFHWKRLKNIRDRNRFLFQWYAISDPLLWVKHICFIPFVLTYFLLRGKMSYPIGFVQALWGWKRFKRESAKRVSKGGEKLKDWEILEITKDRPAGALAPGQETGK
jgi:GT2 family glycosyltransferase